MNIFVELLDFVCKIAYLVAVFGGLAAVLGFARWSVDTSKRTNRKKRQAKSPAVFGGGGGQSLGRASAADLQQVRMARIADNRFQKQATLAKEGKRQQRKQIRSTTTKPPPRSYSSLDVSRTPSPRSVAQVPTLELPKELRPESTSHFFVDGATKFIALPPPLEHSDLAVAMLRRIAQEFMPIIRQRGFNVRSVSEMCCCGDGLEYELGGERRSVAAGETIVGNDHETVVGYNGKLINHFEKAEYVIHLRLRVIDDHQTFIDYEEVVDTMAHELAHCVHEDHGPEFWSLMDDILADRAKILEDLNNGVRVCHDPVAASKEQFGGFDIYQPVCGQMRNWNGQVLKKGVSA